MIKRINFTLAVHTMLAITVCISIFHLLVLSGMVPYDIVWGGRLKNETQMYRFEIVSLSINLLLLAVTLIKAGYLKSRISRRIINSFLWIFAVLFTLNTLGNLMSANIFETIIFTPLTLLSALCCARMVMEKPDRP